MNEEKGYIQFQCDWESAAPPADERVAELIHWRDRLHQRGLIGVYPNGIGFGNLSFRGAGGEAFVISGTATGGLPTLKPQHVTTVTAYDIAANWLRCRGPVQASSESLSHAAVYEVAPQAQAVIHVHHLRLWEHLCSVWPTTDVNAEAGTPQMAWAIAELFQRPSPLKGQFAMGGHREGLMAYGETLAEAAERLLHIHREFLTGAAGSSDSFQRCPKGHSSTSGEPAC